MAFIKTEGEPKKLLRFLNICEATVVRYLTMQLGLSNVRTVSTIRNSTTIQNRKENVATKRPVFSPNSATAKRQLTY